MMKINLPPVGYITYWSNDRNDTKSILDIKKDIYNDKELYLLEYIHEQQNYYFTVGWFLERIWRLTYA